MQLAHLVLLCPVLVYASSLVGPVVVSVDVGTESTRAAVFDADGNIVGKVGVHSHKTCYPFPGWAEQAPEEWWEGLGTSVRAAVASANCDPGRIAALCLDTTSCTVLALDLECKPLRPALLWMDARSARQAAEILDLGKGDPALAVNNGGAGPISAEWMLPKALWLKQAEPKTWAVAATICECQDWLNFRCTGRLVACGCNVAARWHCDGAAAVSTVGDDGSFAGRPLSLLAKIGLSDLAEKWPRECIGMGELIGGLTAEAAKHLGLPLGLPVAQGGPDAFVGLIGLGAATTPGAVGLITGCDHSHAVASCWVPDVGPSACVRDSPLFSCAPCPHLLSATQILALAPRARRFH